MVHLGCLGAEPDLGVVDDTAALGDNRRRGDRTILAMVLYWTTESSCLQCRRVIVGHQLIYWDVF